MAGVEPRAQEGKTVNRRLEYDTFMPFTMLKVNQESCFRAASLASINSL